MYSWKGQFQWYNAHKGYKGRCLYVALLDTSKWPAEAFRRAGQGMVHDYMFKQTFGEDFQSNTASVGGFAVIDGQIRYSSIWLNTKENTSYPNKWYSDGSQYLSQGEQELVSFAVQQWMNHGPHKVYEIPGWLDQRLSGLP